MCCFITWYANMGPMFPAFHAMLTYVVGRLPYFIYLQDIHIYILALCYVILCSVIVLKI